MKYTTKGFGPAGIPFSIVGAILWGGMAGAGSMMSGSLAWGVVIATISMCGFLFGSTKDRAHIMSALTALAGALFVIAAVPIFGFEAIEKLLRPLGGVTIKSAGEAILFVTAALGTTRSLSKAALLDIKPAGEQA